MRDITNVKKSDYVCNECEYIGRGRPQGSMTMEIFLWVCFIVPGIFYSLWRISQPRNVCPECGHKNMIPIKTTKGKKMAQEILGVKHISGI